MTEREKERMEMMIFRYGEAVTKAEAGRIINRSSNTVKAMIEDGRLETACEGTRVDVCSLARYICAPAKIDTETRIKKRYGGCKWHV